MQVPGDLHQAALAEGQGQDQDRRLQGETRMGMRHLAGDVSTQDAVQP